MISDAAKAVVLPAAFTAALDEYRCVLAVITSASSEESPKRPLVQETQALADQKPRTKSEAIGGYRALTRPGKPSRPRLERSVCVVRFVPGRTGRFAVTVAQATASSNSRDL
jgi:hypothetical protein